MNEPAVTIPTMSAEEQSTLSRLARLPLDKRRDERLVNSVLASLKQGSFADGVAHALLGYTNRTEPQAIHYDYAITMLQKMGYPEDAVQVEQNKHAQLEHRRSV
jgi:hypothetical protein